jgi:hypothetical protein
MRSPDLGLGVSRLSGDHEVELDVVRQETAC